MNLVPLVVVDGEPRIDSRLVSSQLGVEHESFRKLIYQYQMDFEEFGILRFEIGEIKGRGQPEKYALLNEDQSYLGLTYIQNTPQARDLKKRLVRSFSEHRKAMPGALPATIPANTALVPILSHMEMARIAPLTPDARQHIQQVFQSIQDLTARERKAQRVDCRVILETVVQDILGWRYGCPYAYGFNVAGRAYLQACSGHVAYHLRTAPHFRPVFEKMNWLDERKIMNEWDAAGLAMKTKASLRMDGSRLDLLINLSRLTVAASSPATQELLQ